MPSERRVFVPPRQRGVFFQVGLALVLLAAAGALYYRAALLPVGGAFLGFLAAALALTVPIPFLLYGAYALRRAEYALDRDRVVLRWGWRMEEIPMPAVAWVRPAAALDEPLPLPRLRWPGMLLGRRRRGEVVLEFMASDARALVVVATEGGWFVISPADVEGFLEAFRRAAEEGSLEPVAARSQRPIGWLAAVWRDRLARVLLVIGWLTAVGALVWSNLAAAGLTPVSGKAANALDRAVLLAVAAWLFQGLNLGLGLFAYQSPRRRAMVYLVWLAGAVAGAGFLASVGVVLRGGGG